METNKIKLICEACWLNQIDLEDFTGIKLQRIKNISAGRVDGFKGDDLAVLVHKMHLNSEWLTTGQGEIFKEGFSRSFPTKWQFVSEVIDRMVKIVEPDFYTPTADHVLGLSSGTVGKWVKDEKIPYAFLKKFSEKYGVSYDQIIYNMPAEEKEFSDVVAKGNVYELPRKSKGGNTDTLKIKRYQVKGGAGSGVINYEEPIIEFIELSAEYVRKELGIKHGDIAIITVKGPSMETTLSDGDQIFVDLRRNRIDSADVYVILVGDELLIKRVQFKTDGMVWLISDNKLFDPEQLTKQEAESLHVVGKVLPCKFGKYSL